MVAGMEAPEGEGAVLLGSTLGLTEATACDSTGWTTPNVDAAIDASGEALISGNDT